MSAAAIPPQTHRETLRARRKARERVADPSTARRLHRVPIIIHTYPPVLSGQNRRSEADKHDKDVFYQTTDVGKKGNPVTNLTQLLTILRRWSSAR